MFFQIFFVFFLYFVQFPVPIINFPEFILVIFYIISFICKFVNFLLFSERNFIAKSKKAPR